MDAPKPLLIAMIMMTVQLTLVTPLPELVYSNPLFVMTITLVLTIPAQVEIVCTSLLCVTTITSALPTPVTQLMDLVIMYPSLVTMVIYVPLTIVM
jgi:hypothetical protein